MGPAYHPDWLVAFWLTTPGLNLLNPHYLLIIFATVLVLNYFQRKRRASAANELVEEDQIFKHLLSRKSLIEKQVQELDEKLNSAEIQSEEYSRMLQEYERHLEQVNTELKQYTL